jgi:hypothetical protein
MTEISLNRPQPDETPITSVDGWTRPKKARQWAPGRSAMELARAWFRTGAIAPPAELLALLRSRPEVSGLSILKGVPELVTPLPERGEGRNHDLWLLAKRGRTKGDVTICIEAKADEPFGNDTIGEYRAFGLKRLKNKEATSVPDRIEKLLALVPGGAVRWDLVRYQLLTAICGTALQAKADGSAIAVFAVHEFHTGKTKAEKTAQNAADFGEFLRVLGHPGVVKAGVLYGPFPVAGIPCLVGKVISK